MARIAGVTLPLNKKIEYALTYIYGIGLPLSNKILTQVKVDKEKRTKDLSEEEVNKIRDSVKSFVVEGDLRREILTNVRRLKEIGCYRGIRHSRRLPVRGQRTKTNSRTVRGNVRKTMGSGKKASAQKT
ncbi:30S ribosomal protein S13 [Candidatus Uhrbacteria bacterium]|nr:30S ribosomal protein S13 [Candidatus Uhrbacteria bacterium]